MRYNFLLAAALLACASGCGEGPDADDAPIPLDKIPAPALKAARERLPHVKFENAWKEVVDGKEVFEIRGKDKDGKIYEAEVTETGEVVLVE